MQNYRKVGDLAGARFPVGDDRALPWHCPGAGADPPDGRAGGRGPARAYLVPAQDRRRCVASPLIDLTLAEGADSTATLHDLKHITDQLLVRNPAYRCTRCGFGARTHHWQCPSCKVGYGQAAVELRGALIHAVARDGALLGLALLSAALTWAARGYALRRQLFDQPGERRSHSVATSRWRHRHRHQPAGDRRCCHVGLARSASEPARGLGLALVAGIGWWDDHRPLPAMRRLMVHFIAAALLAALVRVHGGSWLLAVLVLLFTASLINIWNFMDGINGIAASQAVVVALGLAPLLPWPYSLATIALGLACLGFLPFNFHGPGSSWAMSEVARWVMRLRRCWHWPVSRPTSTGYCCLCRHRRSLWTRASLLARIISGQRWMEPHTQHVYQRAVQAEPVTPG